MNAKLVLLLCLFLTVNSAWSKTTHFYEKRFKVVKEDGKVVSVIDNSISMNFSLKGYISYLKNKIKNEQSIMKASFDYDSSVRALFQDEQSLRSNKRDYIEDLVKSLNQLSKVNVEKIFQNPAFKEVIEKFEAKLKNAMVQMDPRIIARPQDSSFFYKKKKTYQVVLWGLNFAKKKLSTIPLLNTASYIMVEVEKMVRTRREYHQNMLLHYLHNFDEEELGLTEKDANQIFSSIYESRIPWYAFWESQKAILNWNSYGAKTFYVGVRAANAKLRQFSKLYRTRGKRNTYSFQEVSLEGENVIVNLVNNEGMLHQTPAISFSRAEPKKVERRRLLLQLGGLGVSFLPLASFIKDTISSVLKSYYEQQMITEGALYGYFESMEETQDLEQMKSQYLNPFEKL